MKQPDPYLLYQPYMVHLIKTFFNRITFMRVLIIFILALTACNSGEKGKNGIIYKNAFDYNEYIMEKQKIVINIMLDFGKTINLDLDSSERILNIGIEKTEEALNNIKGMPPFKGDSAFRNAAVNSFGFYKAILGNEYKQIVNIRRKGENKSAEDIAFLQTLTAIIGKREERYDRDFHNAQKAFAEKNNLKLVRNKLQEKVDSADEREN
jgi:hypothetical protein